LGLSDDAQPSIEVEEDANESVEVDEEDELSSDQIRANRKFNSIATIEALRLKPSSLSMYAGSSMKNGCYVDCETYTIFRLGIT
jgi:hypothetical protein